MQEESVNILILKHIEGLCTEEEQAVLDHWLEEDERHRRHFEQVALVERELREMPMGMELDPAAAWQSVKGRLAGERPGGQEKNGAPVHKLARRRRLWGAAAALAALAASGWLLYIWLSKPQDIPLAREVRVPRGESREVALPDGSTVRLNADSRLLIPADYGNAGRRLELSGEGYFEVVENAAQPFIVRAGQAYVRVLGTAFNVSAREESGKVAVTVASGTVQFRTESSEGLALAGGQAAAFDTRTGTFQELPEGNPAALAWLEGRLIFKDTPLSEAFRALERRYAVRIEDRADIGGQLLSDTIEKGDPIENFLERLSIAFSISYQKEGGTVIILPGEYPKDCPPKKILYFRGTPTILRNG